ncbi:MAG TPA: hypothetical protein VM489_00035 [Burkholderiales bacterium]|nr:hypothetical protein [Burkholderiales bacterium]
MPPAAAREDLVPLPKAILIAYFDTVGLAATISEAQRNQMAEALFKVLQVYALAPDGSVARTLSAEDVRGATFTDRGGALSYADGREKISGLAVTRTALEAAIAALKAKKSPG